MLWKGNRTKAAYTEQMYRLQHITFQQGMSLQRDLHQKLGNVKKYRPCFSFSTRKKVEIHNQRIFGTEKITHKIRTGSNSAQQKKMLSLFNGKPFCQSSLSAAQFFWGGAGRVGGCAGGTGHLWLRGGTGPGAMPAGTAVSPRGQGCCTPRQRLAGAPGQLLDHTHPTPQLSPSPIFGIAANRCASPPQI